ncbi:MAG: hypothetical protein K2I67_00835 [Malacoplasma sp.]|nr:hypothetical protein [Malacoplasma sp.]
MSLFKKNKPVERVIHSGRRESLKAENNFNMSIEEWNQMETSHLSKVEKMLLEREIERRRKEALVDKKKIFIEEMAKKDKEEFEGFTKRSEIGERINNRKRWELRKRDIAFRNRSILG